MELFLIDPILDYIYQTIDKNYSAPLLDPIISSFYRKGRVFYRKRFGFIHGDYWEWYPNETQLRYHKQYCDGQLHGIYKEFYSNGNIKVFCEYQKDQRHGKRVDFFEHPSTIRSTMEYVNDIKQGTYKEWYPTTDQLRFEIDYAEGKIHGNFFHWNNEGQMIRHLHYHEGLLI